MEFPDMDRLSDVKSNDLPPTPVNRVEITEKEDSVIDVEGIAAKNCEINGITRSSSDGQFVITGRSSSDSESHISVVDMNGGVLRQHKIERVEKSMWKARFHCDSLSQDQVATVCAAEQVGIYEVTDGSYIKRNISDVIENWKDNLITCVAADPHKKCVIMGSRGRRDLLVFDEHLNYLHAMKLPDVINYPVDIKVYDGKLLLCDEGGGKAYIITMEQNAELVHEFPRYNQERKWWPISVCTDSSGFIYMLWEQGLSYSWAKTVLLQYSPDGREILSTRPVDDDSRCITTVKTNNGEKLLLATRKKGKIFVFGLEEYYT